MNTIINELNRDWERILNDNPNNEYFRNIVMDFLKPDLIDSEKFTNNLELIHAEYYFEIEKILRKNKLTTTMSYYSNLENRPSGFPDWFLAAYPDVSKWFSKNIDSIEKIPLFKNIFEGCYSEYSTDSSHINGIRQPEFYFQHLVPRPYCQVSPILGAFEERSLFMLRFI